MHRSDVAGGVRVGSPCRHHRAVLPVHLREQLRVVHEVHTETFDPESKTEGKIKGRPLIRIIDWKEEEILGPFEVSAWTG